MYAHRQLIGLTERGEYLIYLYFQPVPFKAVELLLVNEMLGKSV